MTRRLVVLVLGLLATAPNPMDAQDTRTRWSIFMGPSAVNGHNALIPPSDNSFGYGPNDPIIFGARNGKFNLGVGLLRPLSGALQWRLDLMYNLGVSGPAVHDAPCDETDPAESPFFRCGGPRPALRDELLLATVGFQWDAFPKSRWSPYLLTSVGAALSRLQWSRDHTATHPDETTYSRGPVYGLGVGARFPLWRYEGFIEAQRHRSAYIYSSKFIPLSFGIRF